MAALSSRRGVGGVVENYGGGTVRTAAGLCYTVPMADTRPSWDQYFMTITHQVAERSTCTRAKVGAVITRDRSILATGYNGAPSGMPHCLDVGCLVYESTTPSGDLEQNCFRTIHAEMNAIAQAARNGVSIDGAAFYVTHSPCIHCFKVLVNTGVDAIYYTKPYKLETIEELRVKSGVKLIGLAPE